MSEARSQSQLRLDRLDLVDLVTRYYPFVYVIRFVQVIKYCDCYLAIRYCRRYYHSFKHVIWNGTTFFSTTNPYTSNERRNQLFIHCLEYSNIPNQ